MTFTRPRQRFCVFVMSIIYNSAIFLGNKKPPWTGVATSHDPLILRIISAGIGTLPAALHAGCRASQGRFPPPLLMRAVTSLRYILLLNIFACKFVTFLVESIHNKRNECQGGKNRYSMCKMSINYIKHF
jgi:hypothetical protein